MLHDEHEDDDAGDGMGDTNKYHFNLIRHTFNGPNLFEISGPVLVVVFGNIPQKIHSWEDDVFQQSSSPEVNIRYLNLKNFKLIFNFDKEKVTMAQYKTFTDFLS